MPSLVFEQIHQSTGGKARAGVIRTARGELKTPLFMPVGTHAAVRGQLFETLEASGARCLLANTYHLAIRPGVEVFEKLGGIHRFSSWPHHFLTDSGGFQVFSLSQFREISEEGVSFKSYPDGAIRLLSPEKSIQLQHQIGSDIMMAFDQCVPSTCSEAESLDALERTFRWADRSLKARQKDQALFGIVQGAVFPHLRKLSAAQITSLPFDGFALGGLAVGESREERESMLELTAPLLPADKPRYLMGVGMPVDILEAVKNGVDMFDCILPTSMAQVGVAFSWNGRIELRRGIYRFAEEPIDADCACPTCRRYSRAYLHHLVKTQEISRWALLGTHNLFFYQTLMQRMHDAILEDRFSKFYRDVKEGLESKDLENPIGSSRGNYTIHVTSQGDSRIRHSSGELMHPSPDASEESRILYIEQTKLLAQLKAGPLTVWDVGLGAAYNAMQAIGFAEKAYASDPARHPLHIHSFENDLDSFDLALANPGQFPHLDHDAPQKFRREGEWTSEDRLIHWKLWEGDFLERMEEVPAPDIIFFDPFSAITDSPLWRLETFRRIYRRCQARSTVLSTYSHATGFRAALLVAGFWVGKGKGTGKQESSTVAITKNALSTFSDFPFLDAQWLGRWQRSSAKFPQGLREEEVCGFENTLLRHPQFHQPEKSNA